MKIFTDDLRANLPARLATLSWLDAPLSGGLRIGGAYLFAGAPGGNKTTLLTQIAAELARQRVPVLIVLTEQTRRELEDVFERVLPAADLTLRGAVREYVNAETVDDVRELPSLLRRRVPELYPFTRVIIVDSIQGSGLASTATRTYQRVFQFLDECRARDITTCLVSHVTKRGAIAGPKSLEHKVDVAIVLRKALGLRQLFIAKNRFGPEVVEPILLDVSERGLTPSPHAQETTSAAIGYAGEGDELLEIQASVSLPKLGGRGALACPFLPAQRVRQILTTISSLPGVDVGDLSYSINAYLPNMRGYVSVADLPLALALLSAYLHLPLPTDPLLAGQVDLRRSVRPVSATYLASLALLLSDGLAPGIRRVVMSGACLGLFNESFPAESPRSNVAVVGVRTLDELLAILWPGVFGQASAGGAACAQ
jgi:DNA repair protein RadA/Sms